MCVLAVRLRVTVLPSSIRQGIQPMEDSANSVAGILSWSVFTGGEGMEAVSGFLS